MGMSVPDSNLPDAAWRPVLDAIARVCASDSSDVSDDFTRALAYAEWTWLDDPLPPDLESAALEVASANNWNLADVRTNARKLYYGQWRQMLDDYKMLHEGQRFQWDLPPAPIESLPEPPKLTSLQVGHLHAQGQLAADRCDIRPDIQYKWQGILAYGGWLVTDPRNLEGPVGLLEHWLGEFVNGVVEQMRLPSFLQQEYRDGLEPDARRALYHAYWYRLNTRRARLTIASLRSQFRAGGPKPQPQPYGVSHQGAEQLCAEWLTHLGATNVTVTQLSGDGGIDIIGDGVIAQVKNYAGAVGVEEIRAFHGVASVERRMPVFFTSGKYATGAIDFADRAEMPLLVYDAVAGTLEGGNQRGGALILVGLSGAG